MPESDSPDLAMYAITNGSAWIAGAIILCPDCAGDTLRTVLRHRVAADAVCQSKTHKETA